MKFNSLWADISMSLKWIDRSGFFYLSYSSDQRKISEELTTQSKVAHALLSGRKKCPINSKKTFICIKKQTFPHLISLKIT